MCVLYQFIWNFVYRRCSVGPNFQIQTYNFLLHLAAVDMKLLILATFMYFDKKYKSIFPACSWYHKLDFTGNFSGQQQQQQRLCFQEKL